MEVETDLNQNKNVQVSQSELSNHLKKLYEVNHKDLLHEYSNTILTNSKSAINTENNVPTRSLVISFKRMPNSSDTSSRQFKRRHPRTYMAMKKSITSQETSSSQQDNSVDALLKKKKELIVSLSDLRDELTYVVPERYTPSVYKCHWDFVMDEMKLVYADVYEERKWKVHAAYRFALEAQTYMYTKQQKKRLLEDGHNDDNNSNSEYWSKQVCKMQSQMIHNYWSSIHSLNEESDTDINESNTNIAKDRILFTRHTPMIFSDTHTLDMNTSVEKPQRVLYCIYDYKRIEYIKKEMKHVFESESTSKSTSSVPYIFYDIPSPRMITSDLNPLSITNHPYLFPSLDSMSSLQTYYMSIIHDISTSTYLSPTVTKYIHTSDNLYNIKEMNYVHSCLQKSVPAILYSQSNLNLPSHKQCLYSISLMATRYTSTPTIIIIPKEYFFSVPIFLHKVLPMFSMTRITCVNDLKELTSFLCSFSIYILPLEMFSVHENQQTNSYSEFYSFMNHFTQVSLVLYINTSVQNTCLHTLFCPPLWNIICNCSFIFENMESLSRLVLLDTFYMLTQNFYSSYEQFESSHKSIDSLHTLITTMGYMLTEEQNTYLNNNKTILYKTISLPLTPRQTILYNSFLQQYHLEYQKLQTIENNQEQKSLQSSLLLSTLCQLYSLCNTEDLCLPPSNHIPLYIQPIVTSLPVCVLSVLYPSPFYSVVSTLPSIFNYTIYRASPFLAYILRAVKELYLTYQSSYVKCISPSSILNIPSWIEEHQDTCDELFFNYSQYEDSIPQCVRSIYQEPLFTCSPKMSLTGLYYNWIYNTIQYEQETYEKLEDILDIPMKSYYTPQQYTLTSPKISALLSLIASQRQNHKHIMLYIKSTPFAAYVHNLLYSQHYEVIHFKPSLHNACHHSNSLQDTLQMDTCFWDLHQVYAYNTSCSYPIGIINISDFESLFPLYSQSGSIHDCTDACVIPFVDISIHMDGPFVGNASYISSHLYNDTRTSQNSTSSLIIMNTRNTVEQTIQWYYDSKSTIQDYEGKYSENIMSSLSLSESTPILLPWNEQFYSKYFDYFTSHYEDLYVPDGPIHSYILPQTTLLKDMSPRVETADFLSIQKKNMKDNYIYTHIQRNIPVYYHDLIYYCLYLDSKYIKEYDMHSINSISDLDLHEIRTPCSLQHQYIYPLTYPIIDETTLSSSLTFEPLSTAEKQLKSWEMMTSEAVNKNSSISVDSVVYSLNTRDKQIRYTFDDKSRNNNSQLGIRIGYLKNDSEDNKVKKQKKRVRETEYENKRRNSVRTSLLQTFTLPYLWTLEEDELLKTLVHLYQFNWGIISLVLSSSSKSKYNRSIKDCIDRWERLKSGETVSQLSSYKTDWMLCQQKFVTPLYMLPSSYKSIPTVNMNLNRHYTHEAESLILNTPTPRTPLSSFNEDINIANRPLYKTKHNLQLLKPVSIRVEDYDNDEKAKEFKVYQKFCSGEYLLQENQMVTQKQQKQVQSQPVRDCVTPMVQINEIKIPLPPNHLELSKVAALSLRRCSLIIKEPQLFSHLLVPERSPYDNIAIPSPYMINQATIYLNNLNKNKISINSSSVLRVSQSNMNVDTSNSNSPITNVMNSPANKSIKEYSKSTNTLQGDANMNDILVNSPSITPNTECTLSPNDINIKQEPLDVSNGTSPSLHISEDTLDINGFKEELNSIHFTDTSSPNVDFELPDPVIHLDTPVIDESLKTPITLIGERYNVNLQEENEQIHRISMTNQSVLLLSPRYQYNDSSYMIRYRYPYQDLILESKDMDIKESTQSSSLVNKNRSLYMNQPFRKTVHYYIPVKSVLTSSENSKKRNCLCDISTINSTLTVASDSKVSSNPLSIVGTMNDKDKLSDIQLKSDSINYQRLNTSTYSNNNGYSLNQKYDNRHKNMIYLQNKNQYNQVYSDQNDSLHNPSNNYANLNGYTSNQNKNSKMYYSYGYKK